MYFRFFVVTLFLVSLAIAGEIRSKSNCKHRCGPNERYMRCGRCDEPCFGTDQPCPPGCHEGCFCIPGYVRIYNDYSSICVPREGCEDHPGRG